MAVPGSAAVSPSPLPSPAPEQAEAEAEAEATARATRRPSCGSGGVVGGGGEAKETIGLWGSRVVMGRGGGVYCRRELWRGEGVGTRRALARSGGPAFFCLLLLVMSHSGLVWSGLVRQGQTLRR